MASKLVSELWVKHMNAQTARLRFYIRPFVNVPFVLGLFVSAAMIFKNGFIDVTMIGVVYYLYYYILHKIPVQLECPHCQRTIYSNTPWLCGNNLAHHRNDHVYEFPFLRKCEHCGHEPKSYECQFCREIIFLTPENSDIGFARCADIQEVKRPEPVKRDEHVDDLTRRKREIQIKELEVEQAKLEIALKGLKDSLNPVKLKTVKERLRGRVLSKTELDDEVRRLKVEADNEFPNDEDERAKRYRLIDDEATDLI